MDSIYEGKNEEQLVQAICFGIAGYLYEDVRDAIAATDIAFSNDDDLTMDQKHADRSRSIHRRLAARWSRDIPSKDWEIDGSGWLHLTHYPTGLHVRYRAVDPITRRSPAAAKTLKAYARYQQGKGCPADEIVENLQGFPDLSDIEIVITCDYERTAAREFLWVYKPTEPGKFGLEKETAYSFPLIENLHGNLDDAPHVFQPDPEYQPELLEVLKEGNTIDQHV